MLSSHLDPSNNIKMVGNNDTDINNSTINSNYTDSYNITNPLNDTRCKAECYVNCQVHFPNEIEQKYCIENVCHCVIENGSSLGNITLLSKRWII
jgi:hypothetical protein